MKAFLYQKNRKERFPYSKLSRKKRERKKFVLRHPGREIRIDTFLSTVVDGPIGRWSKVDCQATAVGCWRRPDACASRPPTPSDGAPTLVPSDGPVGRATSQPPVSQPTSLSPSRT